MNRLPVTTTKKITPVLTPTTLRENFGIEHLDYFFTRLAAIYGNAANRFDDVTWPLVRREWHTALQAHTLGTVIKALDDIRNSGNKYPPSVPEFLVYCEKHKSKKFFDSESQQAEQIKIHEPSPLLAEYMRNHPEPEIHNTTDSKERAKLYLENIKSKLRGSVRRNDRIEGPKSIHCTIIEGEIVHT